jgi:glycosyltransferase involved in cell wall biosynthesis
MIWEKIYNKFKIQFRAYRQIKAAEKRPPASVTGKEKILFIFSRFHADPKNIYHKAGAWLTPRKVLDVLEELNFDVYYGGQEDYRYPRNYVQEAKAIIYIAPAFFKIIKYNPKGKLIIFANNSHVLVRNSRMKASAEKWGLPLESTGPEKYFLPAYDRSDYILFSGNETCTNTFLDNGIPKNKIIHWENNVDASVYRPSKTKFPKFTFIHFSSEIGLRKGLPAILKAWEKWNNKNAQLILMGMVTKVGKLLLFEGENGNKPNLPEGVILHCSEKGFPAQDPFVLETLGKCHVGLFPSLEEGQATVALEMAASGLPLIITQECGYELDPSWSFEVKPDDVDSLVLAFQTAYKDPEIIKKGENARELVKSRYNPEIFKQVLKDFFIKAL